MKYGNGEEVAMMQVYEAE
jgi:ribosome-binding factor A